MLLFILAAISLHSTEIYNRYVCFIIFVLIFFNAKHTQNKMTYKETLSYLYNRLPVFHHVGSAAYKPGLENTIRLMTALNNPHHDYHSIHIAGTNGKGSVSHLLASILQEAGYKVGLYTSPHLVDFGERIRVNGKMIDEQYTIDFVAHNATVLEQIQPSFFEATMAMAFRYFADCKVDVAVVEVGLGGRLDSTNIIRPDLSIITNISFDHQMFLGDSLTAIAAEKAGIIKQDSPVVIGESLPETKDVFIEKAEAENAPVIFAEERFAVDKTTDKSRTVPLTVAAKRVGEGDTQNYNIGLSGLYQLKNVATVLCAVDELNKLIVDRVFPTVPNTMVKTISENAIRSGLAKVVENTGLQGRWQVFQERPKVVLDTGHNIAGIAYVVEQLKHEQYDRLHIVFGMVNDKDIDKVLRLLPAAAAYYFTQAHTERALQSKELQAKATAAGLTGMAFDSVKSAIAGAFGNASEKDLIFIGGSNFVVGDALAYLRSTL